MDKDMASRPREKAGLRVRPADAAMLVLVATIWGVNFVPMRWALDEIPPFALSSLRFLLAAVPMVAFVRPPRVPLATIIGYGMAIGVFQFGLLFLAIKLGMAAGLASLLMQMQMFFTIALSRWVVGEAVSRRQVFGGLVCLGGLGILAWGLLQAGAATTAVGLALILLSSFSWASGNVIAKAAARRHRFDMYALVVWSSLVSPLPLALLSWYFEGGAMVGEAIADASPVAWASVLFMAFAATLFGYSTWNRMLRRYPAGVATPFTMVIPVAGLGAAALFLGETLKPEQWLGSAVLLAGIATAVWPSSPESREPSADPGLPVRPLAAPDE